MPQHPEYLMFQSSLILYLTKFRRHTDIAILQIADIFKQKVLNLFWQKLLFQKFFPFLLFCQWL